jgi:DNA-binding response OmpR family regulator
VLRVIVWSAEDLSTQLAGTFVARAGVDLFKAKNITEVRTLAQVVGPQLVLVDRDLRGVKKLVEELRREPATHNRSLAVLARGGFQRSELELLEAGANAILRLPPDAGWDDRVQRLLRVASRQEVRLPIRLAIEASTGSDPRGDGTAQSSNISANGMLLDTALPLQVGQHLSFAFALEGGVRVEGRGRVVRKGGPGRVGIEFVDLDEASREAIRWLVRSSRLG